MQPLSREEFISMGPLLISGWQKEIIDAFPLVPISQGSSEDPVRIKNISGIPFIGKLALAFLLSLFHSPHPSFLIPEIIFQINCTQAFVWVSAFMRTKTKQEREEKALGLGLGGRLSKNPPLPQIWDFSKINALEDKGDGELAYRWLSYVH